MKRSLVVIALLVGFASVQGCSSLNPFGGSPPKHKAAPAGVSSEAAAAQPAAAKRPSESMGLTRFDKNADGTVARAELEETLTADFKKDDLNGDETLDVVEARTLNERLRLEPNTSPVFDWNADGRLVFSEFAAQWRTLFTRSDINRDGIVDDEEMTGKVREQKPRELAKPTFSGKDGRPPGSP